MLGAVLDRATTHALLFHHSILTVFPRSSPVSSAGPHPKLSRDFAALCVFVRTGALPFSAPPLLRRPALSIHDRTDMSWTSWAALVPTVLLICALLAWWFTEPKTAHLNLTVAIGCLLFFWTVAPELATELSAQAYASCVHAAVRFRLKSFLLNNARMLVTGAAVVWYVPLRLVSVPVATGSGVFLSDTD